MVYLVRTIGFWLKHVFPYFVVCAILDAILIARVLDFPDRLYGLISSTLADPESMRSSQILGAIMVFLAPIFGIYVALVGARAAAEADDDFRFFCAEKGLAPFPAEVVRSRLIGTLALTSGILTIPPSIWLYTANMSFLWQSEVGWHAQPGTWVIGILIATIYLLIPVAAPGVFRDLGAAENWFTQLPSTIGRIFRR